MDSTITTAGLCVVCSKSGASGKWEICSSCRAELVERSAGRQAQMAPALCVACHEPRRQPPAPGQIYCPRCRRAVRRRAKTMIDAIVHYRGSGTERCRLPAVPVAGSYIIGPGAAGRLFQVAAVVLDGLGAKLRQAQARLLAGIGSWSAIRPCPGLPRLRTPRHGWQPERVLDIPGAKAIMKTFEADGSMRFSHDVRFSERGT